MPTKIEIFNQAQLKKDLPDIRPGDTVQVYQKMPASAAGKKEKEKGKEKIQIFEGLVLARKHGKGISATITVRRVISGIGVEKIFPIHSPLIEKIEITKRVKVRRAKLYYLRAVKGKKARLKRKEFTPATSVETQEEKIEEKPEEKPEDKPEEKRQSDGEDKEPKATKESMPEPEKLTENEK